MPQGAGSKRGLRRVRQGVRRRGLDVLLSLQEAPESLTGEARAKRQNKDLLIELERLLLGLLSGMLRRQQLARLTRLLAEPVEPIQGPRLAAIIEEIELRTAVAWAKLEGRVPQIPAIH